MVESRMDMEDRGGMDGPNDAYVPRRRGRAETVTLGIFI